MYAFYVTLQVILWLEIAAIVDFASRQVGYWPWLTIAAIAAPLLLGSIRKAFGFSFLPAWPPTTNFLN